jgi:hypothetical protein
LSRSGQVAVVLLGALCGVPPGCALAGTPAAAPPATPDPGSNPAVRAASGPTTGRAPPAAVQDSSCQATVTHVGSDGSAGSERVTRASYSWATTGENVAGGYDDPTHVVVAWLDSPPHRAILLEPEAVHAGVGFTQASEDGFRWFWALTVAAPGELEDTPAIRCHP